jgi:hypothetical protein
MRRRSGIASLAWWTLKATLRFLDCLPLSADDHDYDKDRDSAMRLLVAA